MYRDPFIKKYAKSAFALVIKDQKEFNQMSEKFDQIIGFLAVVDDMVEFFKKNDQIQDTNILLKINNLSLFLKEYTKNEKKETIEDDLVDYVLIPKPAKSTQENFSGELDKVNELNHSVEEPLFDPDEMELDDVMHDDEESDLANRLRLKTSIILGLELAQSVTPGVFSQNQLNQIMSFFIPESDEILNVTSNTELNDAPNETSNAASIVPESDEILNDAPNETSNAEPNITTNETFNDAPNETSNAASIVPESDEILNDAPNETSNVITNETFNDEILNDASNETSNAEPNITTNETFNDAPNETFNDAPNETFNDAPNETFNDAHNETFNDAPNETFNDAPNDAQNNTGLPSDLSGLMNTFNFLAMQNDFASLNFFNHVRSFYNSLLQKKKHPIYNMFADLFQLIFTNLVLTLNSDSLMNVEDSLLNLEYDERVLIYKVISPDGECFIKKKILELLPRLADKINTDQFIGYTEEEYETIIYEDIPCKIIGEIHLNMMGQFTMKEIEMLDKYFVIILTFFFSIIMTYARKQNIYSLYSNYVTNDLLNAMDYFCVNNIFLWDFVSLIINYYDLKLDVINQNELIANHIVPKLINPYYYTKQVHLLSEKQIMKILNTHPECFQSIYRFTTEKNDMVYKFKYYHINCQNYLVINDHLLSHLQSKMKNIQFVNKDECKLFIKMNFPSYNFLMQRPSSFFQPESNDLMFDLSKDLEKTIYAPYSGIIKNIFRSIF
jgi:hypothetical protein